MPPRQRATRRQEELHTTLEANIDYDNAHKSYMNQDKLDSHISLLS